MNMPPEMLGRLMAYLHKYQVAMAEDPSLTPQDLQRLVMRHESKFCQPEVCPICEIDRAAESFIILEMSGVRVRCEE